MTRATEILLVDPAISDLDTLLCGVRTGLETIVLDAAVPAARQMATALRSSHGLKAVHVVAHGGPGRVSFASGDWSVETVAVEADELAAIGRALAPDGGLRLWSCYAGAGAEGDA